MASADSPQNQYAKNLQQSFGYPLRFPEPKPGLPASYAENGLSIGDVGYVNPRGMFEVMFNICFPPDHDLHQARRKDLVGLVGLSKFDPNKVPLIPGGISAGRAICHGIRGPQGDKLKDAHGAPYRFESCSTSGAILILPSGAVCQDLDESLEMEFCELAEKLALDWCQFAGRKSLYLITGFYKTSSWYLGSFHDVGPTKQVLLERDEAGKYTWDSRCDYRQSPGDNLNENQTVLISGFKIEVRGWDKHVLVEKLSPRSRSILSELLLLARSLLGILVFFCQQVASRSVAKLWDYDTPKDTDVNVHVKRVPALSQPFHPSDIINRYLLDKNPAVRVAITHDKQWLRMLEKEDLSQDDMMEEGHFRAFLEENYTDDSKSGVIYLRRKTWAPISPRLGVSSGFTNNNEPNSKNCNDLRESLFSPKIFSLPSVSIATRQMVITHMRVENAGACLERMPIGFSVLFRFGGTKWRNKHKPALLSSNTVEWDDEIILPTDPKVKIQFSINASFEFEPMLGNGETLCTIETSVDSLTQVGRQYFPFPFRKGKVASSLLITLEERRFNPSSFTDCGDGNRNSECDDSSYIQIAEATDEGHSALLHYHRGQGIEELERSAKSFKLALDLCPFGHKCHAATLFNLATAKFVKFLVYGTISDLDVAIASYREVLILRPTHHPDRPATLLHLSQALLYRHSRLRREVSVANEIEGIAKEIKETCSAGSDYCHRAAILVLQTLKRHRVLTSGKLAGLNVLVSELDRSARMPPDWCFDRPYQLINFSTTLRKRFELTSDLDDLDKSISVMEEAARLVSDTHFDKAWMLASLGDAFCARFVQRSDATDLARSIPTIEDAVKLATDGHFHKPWMLACLGNALHVRFVWQGNVTDIDNSISVLEDAVKLAPDNNSDKPWMLASLGDVFCVRFAQRGNTTDLARSISMIEDAVRLSPDGHFDKPWMLATLGEALHVRFVQYGDVTDLDNSISMIEDAMKLAPDGYFGKPTMFASLGSALRIRFVQRGDVADLESSVSAIEHAVKITPDRYIDKPWMLFSLGDALRARFVQRGDVADLENSISMLEEAVKLVLYGHIDKPRILASLGDARRVRFVRRGNGVDLKSSISMLEGVVELTPDGHIDKPWMLASLSDALRIRSVQHYNVADFARSISVMKHAVKLAPDSHLDKPWMLASLGDTLRVRFVRQGDVADLDNSISMIKSAVRLASHCRSDRPRILAFLGVALHVRFVQRGDIADLSSSISMIEDAVKLTADCYLDKPWILTSLGIALRARYAERGNVADLESSISLIECAIKLAPERHFDKLWMLASLGGTLRLRCL